MGPLLSSHLGSEHRGRLRSPLRCERSLEARGVEPLSSLPSTRTSTCLEHFGFKSGYQANQSHQTECPRKFSPRARSLHPRASLLSSCSSLAGVGKGTLRLIKPQERDLGDLHLFSLIRFFTRPTNHPRHAVPDSDNESKPVRPHISECFE